MNHTLIDPKKIAKIKKLNTEIQSLRDLLTIFGRLKPKQQIKLENKENKLTKLLNQL